ncbi:transcription factor IIF subunit tfg1 [Tilletia horrida]|uniref:Transcription factor IIF subunit tfg1 n=1 Tax=Tilletia horrida TaxID=155126 RepID=A0AAN6GBT8_9BASI|nr:transcription factor IIF subunit tfg1 [Tilletia horrida]
MAPPPAAASAKRERSNTPAIAAAAVKKEGTPAPTSSSSQQSASASASASAAKTEAGPSGSSSQPPKPAATFRDFPIFSSQLAPHTRINLLRFAHHTPQDPTDPSQFVGPLKLNRKWPPRPKPTVPRPGDPVRDVGGNHVIGILPPSGTDPNEKPKKGKLYWPSYGEGGLEEIRKALHIPPELNITAFPPQPKKDDEDEDNSDSDQEGGGNASKAGPSSSQGAAANKKGRFGAGGGNARGGGGGGKGKKKGAERRGIREIHKAPEDLRLLRKQEFMPWVLEDFETSEDWESGVQAANRYKALVAQFGDKYANCAGNAGLVQMYLRGAVETAQNGGAGSGLVGEVKEEKKKRAGYMDRNHSPWIGKLEGDVHGGLNAAAAAAAAAASRGDGSAATSGINISSSPHVIFVFDHRHDGSFKLVPVQAAYKFTQKPAYSTTTADEANERWEKLDKLRQRGGSAYQKINLTASSANGEGASQEGQGEGARALLNARSRSSLGGGRRGGPGGRMYVKKEKLDEDDAAELASWSTFQQRNALVLPGMSNSRQHSLLAVYGDRRGGAGGGGGGAGGGGALDEVEYEEDFADDEEVHQGPGAENLQEEQEQKEYADRLKEEMSRAGWDGRISGDENGDDDDEDDDGADADLFGDGAPGSRKRLRKKGKGKGAMGKSGRELKKVMRMAGRVEGMDAYDSEDEDENPYASEEEEEEESDEEKHLAITNPDELVRRAREARREKEEREAALARKRALAAERDGTPALAEDGSRPGAGNSSRANSPASFGPPSSSQPQASSQQRSGSGFASSAQRATAGPSGKGTYIPRRAGSSSPPPPSPSRSGAGAAPPSPPSSGASQPLKVTLKRKSEAISGGGSGRATSPASTTAGVSPPVSRAGSPAATSVNEAKRQKTTTGASSRAASPPSSGSATPSKKQPANDIEREVIRLVRDNMVQTTQELVRHFAKQLKNPESKEQLSAAIRRVCMIERGKNTLRLKDGW